jgi:hypothetical protein
MFGPAIKVINAIRSIKMVLVELIRGTYSGLFTVEK